jgi:hypothetical protein
MTRHFVPGFYKSSHRDERHDMTAGHGAGAAFT